MADGAKSFSSFLMYFILFYQKPRAHRPPHHPLVSVFFRATEAIFFMVPLIALYLSDASWIVDLFVYFFFNCLVTFFNAVFFKEKQNNNT